MVDQAVSDCAAVIHCAAETHVDRSLQDAARFARTNVLGTSVLLEAVRRHGVERFVQVSTDEVYGSCQAGSFAEDSRLNPGNPYAASKASADLMALALHRTHGLPLVIVRSTNAFGPYQYPEKLIPLLVTNALEDRPLPLYGDGLNVRDWLYVEDLCEAIDRVRLNGSEGEIYNIAASQEKTNLEMARSILARLGKPADLMTFVHDRPGHDRRYALDWGKIRELGWRPRHSFAEALEKTIDWFRGNEWWWRKIKKDHGTYREYYRRQYPDSAFNLEKQPLQGE
jgi:dTDP-glucose 4,6-dehydratase